MGIEKLSTIWPEWRLVEKIGEGSYGKVYKVVREEHGLTDYAAVKVVPIPPQGYELNSLKFDGYDEASIEKTVDDFVDEIKLLLSVKGTSHIVSIEDYKVVKRTEGFGWDIFIRMELLTNFIDYAAERKLSEGEVIKLGQDICCALELCAARNIIHRDIKPENIFMSPFKNFKVGDFGIARELEKCGSMSMTSVGTYNYMAPEVRASKKYDATVDIYSLGLVLYRLLNNNRLPFLDPKSQIISPKSREKAVEQRLSGEALPPPVDANPEIAHLILKACAFDPTMRFKTAKELYDALEAVKRGTYEIPAPVKKRTPGKNTETNGGIKRLLTNKRTAIVSAVAFICVVAISAFIVNIVTNNSKLDIPVADDSPQSSGTIDVVESVDDPTTGASSAEHLDTEQTVTFTLYPPKHMTDAEYGESLSIITERVNSMAEEYRISDVGNAIEVTLLRGDLGANPWIIEDTANIISSIGHLTFSGENTFALSEGDILSVEVKTGFLDIDIPDYNSWEYELMRSSDRNDMLYINVKLNSSADSKLSEIGLGNYTANMDAFVSGYSRFGGLRLGIIVPIRGAEDEFNIVLYDFTNVGLNRLVAATLQFPLPDAFSANIDEKITWEIADHDTRGRYQEDELLGNNVTLVFGYNDFTYYDYLSDEDFIDNVAIIKKRMDAIGNPYMVGYSGLDGRNIAIRTSPRRFGDDFINLIGSSGENVSISSPDGIVSNISEFIISQRTYRNYVIYAILNDSIDLERVADDILGKSVFLKVSGVRVSSTDTVELGVNRLLTFSELSFASHSDMNEENKFILDLLNTVVNGNALSYTRGSGNKGSTDLDIIDVIWDDDERDISSHYRWGINCDSHEDALVRNLMTEHFEDVEFSRARGGGSLYFSLNLEANDELPIRFMNLIEDIYTICDFDNSSYTGLYFYNENTNNPSDRLRLFFRRMTYNSIMADDTDIGKMERFAFVYGPTFGKYADEIEVLFDTMDFFADKPRDEFLR